MTMTPGHTPVNVSNSILKLVSFAPGRRFISISPGSSGTEDSARDATSLNRFNLLLC